VEIYLKIPIAGEIFWPEYLQYQELQFPKVDLSRRSEVSTYIVRVMCQRKWNESMSALNYNETS
jgi:hypothetical protein